jgi:hypothetical protein
VAKIARMPYDIGKGYRLEMTMLNKKGGKAFRNRVCKEVFLFALCFDVGVNFKVRVGSGHWIRKIRINRKRPVFVMFGDTDIDKRRREARRVQHTMSLLTKRLKIKSPVVSISKSTRCNAIFVETTRWFLRSPVAVHMLMTCVRASLRTSSAEKHRTIRSFINRVKRDVHNDGEQLSDADYNKTVDGFLNKTLPCLKRPKREDWLNMPFKNAPPIRFRLPGIVEYDPGNTTKYNYTNSILANRFGYA